MWHLGRVKSSKWQSFCANHNLGVLECAHYTNLHKSNSYLTMWSETCLSFLVLYFSIDFIFSSLCLSFYLK